MLDKLLSRIESLRGYAVELYKKLVPLKAIPPDFGGKGELRRAEALQEELERLGLHVERYDARDDRAEGGVRPNLVVKLGSGRPRLWIISHLDTVPEGDASLWKYPPYQATVVGDRVYGRGVEDNLQAVVSSLLLLRALSEEQTEPPITLMVAFVSDEEAGSRYGVRYLLEKTGVFRSGDWVLVPDYCSSDGSRIEVAEKHILWFKVVIEGRQVHASMPHEGLNAHRLGMMFNLELDKTLHEKFSGFDEVFEPPVSTFEPTKKEANVANINTVPGRDVVYWDCRVLPRYDLDDVIETVKSMAYWFALRSNAKIDVEVVMKDAAGEPTSPSHPLVRYLSESIREDRGIEPRPVGIGGGTVARYFRKRGMPAVVWQTCDATAHQPNEYAKIDNAVADARVFARLIFKLGGQSG
ncbi:acetylornithine deacetylase or succinyl-diaminopimelate desuccinylase [Pyrolobus fumarii 1A]|uniref:Acetylornithine deacetylase or succinyl-diaminopimelate desuccinylase n=1 Tax=Pyrolobus fumarii (strain DSM 11204 / 1A) TaxID=694429 RepID=G0EF08_PYRF1|nr:M20 family metallo-hydrolase [Pyrolobus fumarii]AEM38905.1 acetylornithine deacetylase or succinyl-diaminopimelate desuccinylase [Pyrolobus fumarii 1A]